MITCREIRALSGCYLDEELQGQEQRDFEAHLNNCDSCRVALGRERQFLSHVREAAPLYSAPSALRERAALAIASAEPLPSAPRRLRNRIKHRLESRDRVFKSALVPRLAIASVIFLVIAVGLFAFLKNNQPPPDVSHFALMAAETHLRQLRGQLPLEIKSGSPVEISQWFHGKLQFVVKLPNYQESSGQEKLYELAGARLVGYKDDYAAYVAYRMRTSPLSLVITSDTVARPSGGEQINAKGITFHYNLINGLKVITWSDRGLTYALVSDLEERGQQSCIVCHQGDRELIQQLSPK
jgi:anti-sigma factor RsiW